MSITSGIYVNEMKFNIPQILAQNFIFITCPGGPMVECWIRNLKVAGSNPPEDTSFTSKFLFSHNLSLLPSPL